MTFTAEMEGKLDDVEVGKEQWQRVIDTFYKPFSKEVAKAESEMEKIQIKDEPAGFDCEVCGSPMVIKLGRFGKFYACSNFPDCRHTQAIVKEIGVEVSKLPSRTNHRTQNQAQSYLLWLQPLPRMRIYFLGQTNWT